jgi:hypothetical protein
MNTARTRWRATTGSVRARGATAALLAVLLAASVTAACTPFPEDADPYRLWVSIGEGQMTLDWVSPDGQPGHEYEVQYLTEQSGWIDLPRTTSTSATFDTPLNRTRYTFRVRTAANGGTPPGAFSRLVSAVYVDLLLPVIRIDTDGRQPILDRENYVRGSMTLDPKGSGYAPYSGTIDIRGRGNSTWKYPKKPYRIRLDTSSPLMGIASNRHWVLLANFLDRSQVRSWVAGELGKQATNLAWTPTFRHVEVVLNGDYVGVYQLTEHVRIGSNRVAINSMSPSHTSGSELTGGYLLEIDGRLEENNEPGFRTARTVPVVIKDPDPAQPEQFNYIRNYVQSFENALFSSQFTDPSVGYRSFVDVGSYIDHYLVQELTRNQDVFWSSTYFYKPRNEKIRFGPLWDFDASVGTTRAAVESPPEGWRARDRGTWVQRFFRDPAFVQEVIDRWDALKPGFDALPAQTEALGESLRPAIANDQARWWNYEQTPADEPQFIREWLETRIAWMDAQYHPTG